MRKHYKSHVLAAFRIELGCDEAAIFDLRNARNQATSERKYLLASAMDRALKRRVHLVRHKNIAKGLVRGRPLYEIERLAYSEPDWGLLEDYIYELTGVVYPKDWLEDHNGCLDTINHEATVSGKILEGFIA